MKVYVQFLTKDLTGKIVTALGSDGVFILDARNRLSTMIQDSRDRMNQLKLVKPHYLGFMILRGDRFSNFNDVLYIEKQEE